MGAGVASLRHLLARVCMVLLPESCTRETRAVGAELQTPRPPSFAPTVRFIAASVGGAGSRVSVVLVALTIPWAGRRPVIPTQLPSC